MSRFDDLTALAIKRSDGFQDMQQELQDFAKQLVAGWREYLGAPELTVYCLDVDRNGNIIGERSGYPTPCFCFDTFSYFDLGMEFPSPTPPGWAYNMEAHVGIKKIGDDFIVKLSEGREFQVQRDNIEKEFYEPFFQDVRTLLATPWTEGNRVPFGFRVPARESPSGGKQE
jgi:hypothetical protein